jgi:hypothetical protein
VLTNADATGATTAGQTMRWYTSAFSEGQAHRRTITFGPGTQTVTAMAQQHLPAYSVNDANPYWDWDATPRPGSFADSFTRYDGNWSQSGGVLSASASVGAPRAAGQRDWFGDFTLDVDVRLDSAGGNARLTTVTERWAGHRSRRRPSWPPPVPSTT